MLNQLKMKSIKKQTLEKTPSAVVDADELIKNNETRINQLKHKMNVKTAAIKLSE